MTGTPDTTAEAQPIGPRRQRRIASANARHRAVLRDRLALYRTRGYAANEIARLTGLPIETVLAQDADR